MAYQSSRIRALREMMNAHAIDVLYIRRLANIIWATGFEKVFDTEPAHALIITSDKVVLHSDSRYSEALEREARDSDVRIDDRRISHADALINCLLQDQVGLSFASGEVGKGSDDPLVCSGPDQAMSDQATAKNAPAPFVSFDKALENGSSSSHSRIGIEDSLTLAEYRQLERALKKDRSSSHSAPECSLELVELSDFVETLRQVKDEEEIRFMRQAQSITDRAFDRILEYIRPGMTEREVQMQLDRYLLEEGAEGLSFETIVAAGPHASSPHAVPGDTLLSIGDAVVMDFGVRFSGYCSDMTRTVFIGEPSDELRRAWETLRTINETCAAELRAGVRAGDVHQKAEDMLAEAGYEGRMGHSLGHGVGIDIHEGPNLSSSNSKPLKAGNVVTVEPGIYIPGEFGMRLEDFGVVTNDGFDVFTQSSHKMFIIDKLS